MIFHELEKYVNELNKTKNDNCCLICHLGNETECIKLNCNHYYHKNCINKMKKCPYCNKNITVNKLDKKILFIKLMNTNTCTVILKTGKRKGEECGRNNCGYHN